MFSESQILGCVAVLIQVSRRKAAQLGIEHTESRSTVTLGPFRILKMRKNQSPSADSARSVFSAARAGTRGGTARTAFLLSMLPSTDFLGSEAESESLGDVKPARL